MPKWIYFSLRPFLLGLLVSLAIGNTTAVLAEEQKAEEKVLDGLERLRLAALRSDPVIAEGIFAPDFVLISQSGKVYGREAALLDLRNGFETWDNSAIEFHLDDAQAIVVLVNRRQRTGMEPAFFRVMQVWRKSSGGWVMIAQSSVRMSRTASGPSPS